MISILRQPSPMKIRVWALYRKKELVTRMIKMQEMLAIGAERERARADQVTQLGNMIERMEQILKELLRKTPAAQTQRDIAYSYVSAKSTAEIRQLRGLNMSHFALALEQEVYQDDTSELEVLVDLRIRSEDRVLFIQQCLFKYDISAHLRESSWKKVKDSMNSRIRQLWKTLKERCEQQNRHRQFLNFENPLLRNNSSRPALDCYYFDE